MPSQLDVDKIRHTNGTDALTFDASGNTNLQKDLKFSSTAAIKNSAGNNILSESGSVVTLTADAAVIEGSSSGDLVRITQTGTGNALVVEDSANPDSTPFVVDASGNVTIGTLTPPTTAHFSIVGDGSAPNPTISSFSASSAAGSILFAKARGSLASPTIVNSGDGVLNIAGYGWDGSAWKSAAQVLAQVDGTPGTNDMPGRLVFSTTADGSSNPTERMRIDSSGNVGIGTDSPGRILDIRQAGDPEIRFSSTDGGNLAFYFGDQTDLVKGGIFFNNTDNSLIFRGYNNTDRMRIDSSGNLLVGKESTTFSDTGFVAYSYGRAEITTNFMTPLRVNRTGNDGYLIEFLQDTVTLGQISVSGSTVSYNGGHLSRWSQLADNTRDESIVKGTVMSNLDQMAEWTNDEVTEDNEQLNCMKVSDVEGDSNVAGVFVNWDDDDDIYTNDMNVAMTGDMVIRIAQGTTVQRGDLLMSAGDGTAKPQEDDIVRSKTIAKVTSTHVSHTYEDGSYLIPCVLMAC